MASAFAEAIRSLPEADLPVKGATAYLSQGNNHQVLFMEFAADAELPEHSHESQWGIVVEGQIDLTIAGVRHNFRKGDHYFIPKGVAHSSRIHAGYADITFFAQVDRYREKRR